MKSVTKDVLKSIDENAVVICGELEDFKDVIYDNRKLEIVLNLLDADVDLPKIEEFTSVDMSELKKIKDSYDEGNSFDDLRNSRYDFMKNTFEIFKDDIYSSIKLMTLRMMIQEKNSLKMQALKRRQRQTHEQELEPDIFQDE